MACPLDGVARAEDLGWRSSCGAARRRPLPSSRRSKPGAGSRRQAPDVCSPAQAILTQPTPAKPLPLHGAGVDGYLGAFEWPAIQWIVEARHLRPSFSRRWPRLACMSPEESRKRRC